MFHYFISTFAMAQAPGAGPAEGGPNPIVGFMPMMLILFVFYFLLLRPQQKKQKEHDTMIANVAKHDEIVTSGGIHGTIVALKDDTVTIRIDDKVRVEIDRSAIGRVTKKKNDQQQVEESNG